jgi:TrmH RNA methyltransferase
MIEDVPVEPLTRDDLGQWAEKRQTGVVLHAVGNDFNAGAIVRAAAFFDASLVVIAETETETDVRLSTAAYRVAEGGMEHVAVRSVRKTAAFLRDAAASLFVIGTDPRARLQVGDLPALLRERDAGGIALVLGNEERGLPHEVKRHCTALLRIPGTGNIESLNVAQSAAVFLHAIYEA